LAIGEGTQEGKTAGKCLAAEVGPTLQAGIANRLTKTDA